MANDHLVQLVRNGLAHGRAEEELRESLCRGWAKEEVNAAFARVQLDKYPFRLSGETDPVRKRTSRSPVSGIVIMLLILCLLFAGAYEGYTILAQQPVTRSTVQMVPSTTSTLPPNSVEVTPSSEPSSFLHRAGDTPAAADAAPGNTTQDPHQ